MIPHIFYNNRASSHLFPSSQREVLNLAVKRLNCSANVFKVLLPLKRIVALLHVVGNKGSMSITQNVENVEKASTNFVLRLNCRDWQPCRFGQTLDALFLQLKSSFCEILR